MRYAVARSADSFRRAFANYITYYSYFEDPRELRDACRWLHDMESEHADHDCRKVDLFYFNNVGNSTATETFYTAVDNSPLYRAKLALYAWLPPQVAGPFRSLNFLRCRAMASCSLSVFLHFVDWCKDVLFVIVAAAWQKQNYIATAVPVRTQMNIFQREYASLLLAPVYYLGILKLPAILNIVFRSNSFVVENGLRRFLYVIFFPLLAPHCYLRVLNLRLAQIRQWSVIREQRESGSKADLGKMRRAEAIINLLEDQRVCIDSFLAEHREKEQLAELMILVPSLYATVVLYQTGILSHQLERRGAFVSNLIGYSWTAFLLLLLSLVRRLSDVVCTRLRGNITFMGRAILLACVSAHLLHMLILPCAWSYAVVVVDDKHESGASSMATSLPFDVFENGTVTTLEAARAGVTERRTGPALLVRRAAAKALLDCYVVGPVTAILFVYHYTCTNNMLGSAIAREWTYTPVAGYLDAFVWTIAAGLILLPRPPHSRPSLRRFLAGDLPSAVSISFATLPSYDWADVVGPGQALASALGAAKAYTLRAAAAALVSALIVWAWTTNCILILHLAVAESNRRIEEAFDLTVAERIAEENSLWTLIATAVGSLCLTTVQIGLTALYFLYGHPWSRLLRREFMSARSRT